MSDKSILAKSVLNVKATAGLNEEIQKELENTADQDSVDTVMAKYIEKDKNEDS